MSNLGKAALALHGNTGLAMSMCEDFAEIINNAGLLVPDAPEPRIDLDGWQEWGHKHGSHVTLEDGVITVVIPDDISRDLTREEAQELATWLNAAANEAKRGRP